MSIIKIARKKNPYVMLDKTCLMDLRLSWRAKGLHAYIMGLPDEWDIRVSHLVKQSTEGRDSVYTTINELMRFGYIQREQERDETGKYSACNYICYENPQVVSLDDEDFSGLTHSADQKHEFSAQESTLPGNPDAVNFNDHFDDFDSLPGNQDTENQLPEKQHTAKPTLVINKSNNNQVNKLITAAIAKPEAFEKTEPTHFAAADLFLNAQNAHPPAPSQTHNTPQTPKPQSSALSGIDTQIDHALGLTTAQKDQVQRRLAVCGKESLASAVMHCLLDRSTYTRSGLDFAHKLNVIMKQIRDNQFAYVTSPAKTKNMSASETKPTLSNQSQPMSMDPAEELLAGIAQWENMARLASEDTQQSLKKMIENAKEKLSSITGFSGLGDTSTFSPTTT